MSDTTQFDDVTLRWSDFYWSGVLDIPLLGYPGGGGVELGINTMDEEQIEPCQDQIRAWRSFIEMNDAAREAMLDAVFAYYSRMRPQYAKAGPEWIVNMPPIQRTEELIKMIRLSAVTVTWPYNGEPVQIGVRFGCNWDREHGLGVVFEGDRIVDVGGADCAIL